MSVLLASLSAQNNNRNGSNCKQFRHLSCTRTDAPCLPPDNQLSGRFIETWWLQHWLLKQLQTDTFIICCCNTAHQSVAMTIAYLFLICRRTGREVREKPLAARQERRDWPNLCVIPPLHWLLHFSVLLSSRHACPALMWGDGVQWPGPEISCHSELLLGGLQLTRIVHTSGWPLGIA